MHDVFEIVLSFQLPLFLLFCRHTEEQSAGSTSEFVHWGPNLDPSFTCDA